MDWDGLGCIILDGWIKYGLLSMDSKVWILQFGEIIC